MVIAIAIALFNGGITDPDIFLGLFSFLECCSSIGVFGVTIAITLGTFLLWHSVLLAGFTGVSVMTMLVLVLSMAATLSNREKMPSLEVHSMTARSHFHPVVQIPL